MQKEQMKRPSEQIEEAQGKLHSAILEALSRFSADTGLTVPDASWESIRATNDKGQTISVAYYRIRTTLECGSLFES